MKTQIMLSTTDDLNDLQLPHDRQYTEAELAQYIWKPTGIRFVRGEKHEHYTGCTHDLAEHRQATFTHLFHFISAAEQIESVEEKRVEWWNTLAIHERRRDAPDTAVFEPS